MRSLLHLLYKCIGTRDSIKHSKCMITSVEQADICAIFDRLDNCHSSVQQSKKVIASKKNANVTSFPTPKDVSARNFIQRSFRTVSCLVSDNFSYEN